MAATIDATVGGVSANAYCTLAEANAFIETHPYTTAWDAATTDTKNRAIITATRLLDERVEWHGAPATTTQRLAWPMSGMVDRNGNAIEDDELPEALKQAVAEYARQLVGYDYTAEPGAARDGLKRVKAGSVEIEYRDGLALSRFIPESVWSIVSMWGVVRERRSASVPLLRG